MTTPIEGNRVSERRRWNMKDIAVFITLILNFSGIIWFAAKMDSSLQNLGVAVGKLDRTVEQVVEDLIDIRVEYNRRLGVLEDRSNRQKVETE